MLIQQFLLPLLCAGLLMPGAAGGAGLPLQLHPDNPHYFLWRGQPTVLITSGEHYGAVLNADFDYVKDPDTLAADRLNLTRTWTGGTYCEPVGAFNIARNTLAPLAGRFRCPFARSDQPGTRAAGTGSTWSGGTRATSSGSATSWHRHRRGAWWSR